MSGGIRLMKVKEVAEQIGLSVATVWRMVAAGTFPRPVNIAPRATRWRSDSVETWIESQRSQDAA